jgi:DNA repair protein RecO (recombination protein O)
VKKFNFTGVVISRTNFGEADRFVTFYTLEMGKITLRAKGIRKITSKRAGSLELFNLVKASAVSGRGQSFTLTEVQLLDSYSTWKNQIGRVNLAYQVSEAVARLTPDSEPHPEVFNLLTEYLESIPFFGTDWQKRTSDFLLRLLVILGFWSQDREFSGDIYTLIESVSNQRFNSSQVLRKISKW